MHPVALPIPTDYTPAMISYDHDAVCFHVNYPWKPSNTGMQLGEIAELPPEDRGSLYGLDTVEEVVHAVQDLLYILGPDAVKEIKRRGQIKIMPKLPVYHLCLHQEAPGAVYKCVPGCSACDQC